MSAHRAGKDLTVGLIHAAVWTLLLVSVAGADIRMAITPTKLHLALQPGVTETATVEVSNKGDDAIRMIAYAVDWTTPRDGGMVFADPGEIDRSASAWVRTDLSEFILPPHESQIVRVTASLPDTARGSYWTLVFFEGAGETQKPKLGVATKARMGATIYLTAKGTEERADVLTGMEVRATAESDTLQLVTSVANRGNVYYYPEGWFQVLDDGGQVLFEEKLPLRVLLPGRETVYRLPWLPESTGSRRLVATVDSGVETLMQGVKAFVVPGRSAPLPVPVPPPVVAAAKPTPAAGRAPVVASAPPVIAPAGPSPSVPAPATTPDAAPVFAAPNDSGPLYGVHVASFATAAEIAVAKRRYLAMDYPVTIDSVEVEGRGTWHRVILGRFADKAEARKFTSGLAEALKLNYMSIVRLEP